MKNICLTLPSLFLSVLFLTSCSTTPNSLQLTPQLNTNHISKQIKSDHSWFLSSKDLRTARYLIAISSGNNVATLINESVSTRDTIEKTLQTHWLKQGHSFSDDSNNDYKIDIQLLKLLATVEQSPLLHETDINVIIKVQVSSAKTNFNKIFRSHYEKEMPFNANVDTLAKQLNTQLSQLLQTIVQDPELNDKLLTL